MSLQIYSDRKDGKSDASRMWIFPKSFVDRYFADSKDYIRWGYKLSLVPLLGFMPFAYLLLDENTKYFYIISHVFLAVLIAFLINLTHSAKRGWLVYLLTFVVYVIGGTTLNLAASLNSSPPVVYATVGHIEIILLLFIVVRAPWVFTIPYCLLVITVFSYIVVFEWSIDSITAATIIAACYFIILVVGMGAYSRDKQAYLLYQAQDSVVGLENERFEWESTLLKFLNHEISNQIAGIKTSFQMIAREAATIDERYITRGMKSTNELQALVRRTADAVSIDDLVQRLDLQEIDLVFLLGEVVEEYEILPESFRKIHVHKVPSFESYVVSGDYLLIKQLFRNLLDNALRHSTSGSVIDVVFEADGVVSICNHGDELTDDVSHLFTMGGKGSSSVSGNYGMGLYLAKKIATAHGGVISASNPKDSGAVFSVRIPLN